MAVNPDERQLEQVAAAAARDPGGPLVMLNLNGYRERARYRAAPPGGASPDVSGREAYARYGVVAFGVIQRVGAQILWNTSTGANFVGEPAERYDEVIAVRYPSLRAFQELLSDPAILEASAHRDAGLERALVIPCADSGEGPLRERSGG